jgi:ABC-type phosphonate transport system ATPase subunit
VIFISGYNESQAADLVFGPRLCFLHEPFCAMDLSLAVRRIPVSIRELTQDRRPEAVYVRILANLF